MQVLSLLFSVGLWYWVGKLRNRSYAPMAHRKIYFDDGRMGPVVCRARMGVTRREDLMDHQMRGETVETQMGLGLRFLALAIVPAAVVGILLYVLMR